MKKYLSRRKRLTGATIGALGFIALIIILDRSLDAEALNEPNYWIKILIMGASMFAVYYFLGPYKDLRWKDIFSRKK